MFIGSFRLGVVALSFSFKRNKRTVLIPINFSSTTSRINGARSFFNNFFIVLFFYGFQIFYIVDTYTVIGKGYNA